MNAALLSLLLLVCVAIDKPAAKLPLGKDTTYVTGPLDKRGYIDYEVALNAELSKGITAQNNAMALLLQALGPTPEGSELPPAYYQWLDVAAPPNEGDYIVGLGTFATDRIVISAEQREKLFEFQGRATQRPWVAKDCPPLAAWIKLNEKPLVVAVEAVKRSRYFNPLCTGRKGDEASPLIGALLPTVQKCREIAGLLACRAMLRLGENKPDEAWADILACHRLGRHVTHGATLIELLVGAAVGQIANNATLAYIDRADLTPKQALARMTELRGLPAPAPVADKLGTCERMVGLDTVQLIRRNPKAPVLEGLLRDDRNVTEDEIKALEKIDWTPVMQTMNAWYDRMVGAARVTDRAAREKAFARFDEDFKAVRKEFEDAERLKKLLQDKDAGKEIGKVFGGYLMGQLMPSVQKIHQAQDRVAQVDRNVQVAFALAAYRKDEGKYPAKLADLAPKYLKEVPDDLFSGKALIYKPDEKGYLFYSVGPNGKDDDGRGRDDDPSGDDLPVQMPRPPLKKN